jgi:hypothetical protein
MRVSDSAGAAGGVKSWIHPWVAAAGRARVPSVQICVNVFNFLEFTDLV